MDFKKNIWISQIPLIIIFASLYYIFHAGATGTLESEFLRDHVYPYLRIVDGKFTDIKFKLRGEEKPKKKIVIVGIDSDSIEQLGRWPWSRDLIAILIQSINGYRPKSIGLDIVFSEKDEKIPGDIKKILMDNGLEELIYQYETDLALQSIVKDTSSQLVLGWTTETACQPLYDSECAKYVTDDKFMSAIPPIMPAFSYSDQKFPKDFKMGKTPIISIIKPITNIDLFSNVAQHAGLFNVLSDPDATVRRTNLVFLMNKMAYPTLALEMARAGLKEELAIELTEDSRVKRIGFKKMGKDIDINQMGIMQINFRGKGYTYDYVSALDVMNDQVSEVKLFSGDMRTVNKEELFKDAYVLIGLTAIGVFDMRSYPFDENVPGVEGHANILDNILSKDWLKPGTTDPIFYWTLGFMILGVLIYCMTMSKLSVMYSSILFITFLISIACLDLFYFFKSNINWNWAFLLIEILTVHLISELIRYFLEEQDKKFLKNAFGNYISPELIDQMYEAGEEPQLGGEERVLTAYFTDIQSFSTFSEKLTPAKLVELLNEYLTAMTDILLEEGGTLDKYEGDAIIAFFGAPLLFEDHAVRACRVAAKMQLSLLELRKKWVDEGDKWPDVVKEMRMRIGVNSGAMVTGNMGSKSRMNYTMMGDTVNLAARLEEAAKQYGIFTQISMFTQAMIGDDFVLRELDTVRVVGKSEPVTTYDLLGLKDQTEPDLVALKELFEEGVKLYKSEQWDKAISQFKKSLEYEWKRYPDLKGKKTNPSEVYIDRCKTYKADPPPKDWGGVFTLTKK